MSFFNKSINLDGFQLSLNGPAYFIAEIGGNFYNFEMAKRLIDDAIESGTNAVKLQTLEAETITTKNNYISFNGEEPTSQYENFKKAEPDKDLQKEVMLYGKERGITVFSAPSHFKDFEFMEEVLNVPIYKIGSDLCNHTPLLKEIGRTKKPIILSTGLSYLDEVRESIEAIKSVGCKELILLHCVSNYPCSFDEVNLRAIDTLKNEFDCLVGYSDHTLDIEISLAAIARGAKVIERHFTYDKTLDGPDHKLSSTKDEFKKLINYSRNIEIALGDGVKKPVDSEIRSRETNRTSIIVMKDLKKGDILTKEVIDIRRPGSGLKPSMLDNILGKKVTIDLSAETPLLSEMLV